MLGEVHTDAFDEVHASLLLTACGISRLQNNITVCFFVLHGTVSCLWHAEHEYLRISHALAGYQCSQESNM
jgi:hypothetical protein